MKLWRKLKDIWANPQRRIHLLLTLYICTLPIGVIGIALFDPIPVEEVTTKNRLFRGLLLTMQIMTFSTTGEIVPYTFYARLVAIFVKINSLICVGGALYAALQVLLFDRVEKITEARIRQIQAKPINIFLSYRGSDSGGHTGRLYDRLSAFFGPEHVCMAIEPTNPGDDFPEALEKGLSVCNILIVVIGPNWLAKEAGKSLIFEEKDMVRRAIHHAIQNNLPIIPVLINEAYMPTASELPDDIGGILRRHAHTLRDGRWNSDVQKLIDLIDAMRKRL
jgi:hypothetical protein